MPKKKSSKKATIKSVQWYGWSPDIPDFRDFMFSAPEPVLADLPPIVDLRPLCPEIYNQGRLGSCTAQSLAAVHQFNQMKQKAKEIFIPSKLFIYYNERVMKGTVEIDSGAHLRDGIKSINELGVCPETMWPYDIKKFRDKPTKECYDEASDHQILGYSRVAQDLNQIKGCLASGFPFVFGFAVYNFFESQEMAKTGILRMPTSSERMLGGHAVGCVGYLDDSKQFIIRNSWGSDWGLSGYFLMPYEYLTNSNLSADLWVVKLVENN